MTCIVQKFGGTSLATVDLIKKAALHTKQAWEQGHHVAVVVSAMAGTTNELVAWVQQTGLPQSLSVCESDTVLAAGEQITSGLFALCLQEYGIPSRSWQGWQLPLYTSGPYGASSIHSIGTQSLLEGFNNSVIPVVAGFQGLQKIDQRITTLGRGGSDTTAVALAAALKADYCAIFTDVEGIYTADPLLVPKAKKMSVVGYEETLEMASLGAKVLHPRSVEIAFQHHLKVWVLSSFLPINDHCGTWVMATEQSIESTTVKSISYQKDQSKIILYSVKESSTFLEQFLLLCYKKSLIIEALHHHQGNNFQETTFFIHKNQQECLSSLLQHHQDELKINYWHQENNLAKISLIGHGLKHEYHIIRQLLQTLQQDQIPIISLTQSEISISVMIPAEPMEDILRKLHSLYELD